MYTTLLLKSVQLQQDLALEVIVDDDGVIKINAF